MIINAKKLYLDKLICEDKRNYNGTGDTFGDRVMTPVVVVSRNEDRLGRILNCNLMLTEISGYYK